MSLKVINLGLPKSGTTTLARALRRAGMRVADHRVRKKQTDDETLQGASVAVLLYEGYFAGGDPAARLGDFDALTELSMLGAGRSLWPQMDFALIDRLRAHHPGVKFLGSRRDAFEMSQSMLAWSDLGVARLPNAAVPGLPKGYGETGKERMQWIEGHYAALAHWFRDDPYYLEYDVADPQAPVKIGAHIGRNLPWWGKANVNPLRHHKEGA
ncbi:sulfotransferase family protein [Marinibacterium profundimaris]|uniref:Sulfotransferase family protein n=1 Tax=Marinibacterium profundimaris TaxID=1679460 RepID=A0A225NSN6_9RHOB|nr:sulfotransferase family protein [Marinibacterium profundimaris]OWU77853.1 hypothetical protein ATO3_04245 [Marinibacterium profundimaris]